MDSAAPTRPDANALELLEGENLELRDLFARIRQQRGPKVDERAAYGKTAKEIIRHIATREAAVVEVCRVASADPSVHQLTARIEQEVVARRPHIDRVEKMSRGVQAVNLRTGQDFDFELDELIQLVGTEIDWELAEAIPDLKGSFRRSRREVHLKSARHIRRHAPTNLHPKGPRWWERAPVVSRLVTVYDHIRDFPRGAVRSH